MAKPQYLKWEQPDNLALLEGWASEGITDAQIACMMGISRQTLYAWKNNREKINNALEEGKSKISKGVDDNIFSSSFGSEKQKPGTSVQLSEDEIIAELKKPCMSEFQGCEKEFEENIFINLDQICETLALPPIAKIERQRCIQLESFQIIPDILVRHEDGTMTVFEVKKINNKNPWTGSYNQMNAVGQLLLYGNVIETIIKAPVRLVLIDNKILYRTYCAFAGHKLPITLVDFQKDRVFIPYCGWNTEAEGD